MSDERVNLQFEPFRWVDHQTPKGALPTDLRAHACWYYYVLAHQQWEKVGKGPSTQIILEGELWLDKHYVQTKRTVALMYGLESPDEMDKFWSYVIAEAAACNLPCPRAEYMRASPLSVPTTGIVLN